MKPDTVTCATVAAVIQSDIAAIDKMTERLQVEIDPRKLRLAIDGYLAAKPALAAALEAFRQWLVTR